MATGSSGKGNELLEVLGAVLVVAAAVVVGAAFLEKIAPAAPSTRPCPKCTNPVPLGVKICSHCGSELVWGPRKTQEPIRKAA